VLTTKNGRSGLTWLDHTRESPQKVIWTYPLDRSRRVDQDPYIECPIRSRMKSVDTQILQKPTRARQAG
jgi:hypothetical protein